MKKVLMIIGGIAVFFVILFVVIFGIASATSEKLVCKSNEGSITIMYDEDSITGYTANGMTYDLDGQQKVAEQIGVDAYLDEFSTWFSTNTTGTCTR